MKFINMGRPKKIKTELGQRLTDIRKTLGHPERPSFTKILKISKETLGNYERGDREPDLKFLCLYVNYFGVNLNWLATGEGEMFTDPGRTPSSIRMVDPVILECIAQSVETMLRTLSQKPAGALIIRLSAQIYNTLLQCHTDLVDKDEVAAAITLETLKLKKNFPHLFD